MFEIECLTHSVSEDWEIGCWILCDPNAMCGPDYGVDCMPDCDPADD